MSTTMQDTAAVWHGNGTNGVRVERASVVVHRLEIETTKRVEIRDLTALVQEIVRNSGIEAGLVTVNLPTAGVDYHVPFGGRKGSSYGSREQGRYAVEFYTTVKTAYTLP